MTVKWAVLSSDRRYKSTNPKRSGGWRRKNNITLRWRIGLMRSMDGAYYFAIVSSIPSAAISEVTSSGRAFLSATTNYRRWIKTSYVRTSCSFDGSCRAWLIVDGAMETPSFMWSARVGTDGTKLQGKGVVFWWEIPISKML